ncbi:MAG: tetratricopeptide repeat protein [Candidatus Obscuribacterales bacterium]|nr:tetratricopeptide repeat protein [Candidatus Obscuribacterales bacterium]
MIAPKLLHKLNVLSVCLPFLSVTVLACHAAGGSSTSAQAMVYFQKGNYRAAQPLFEKLVAGSPSDSRALYYLALVYYKQNNVAQAQSQFQKIVSAFPSSPEAKYSLHYLTAIEGKSVFTEENATPPKATAKPSDAAVLGNDKADRDLAEAKAQAETIIAESKRHAAEFDKQAKDMQDELKQVLVGKRFARPAYSQDQLNAATADLRQQSKFTLDRGKKEAEDLLNRAQMRYEAQTRSH